MPKEIRNRIFAEFEYLVALTGNEKLMLNEHGDKLFAVHQRDDGGTGARGFFLCSFRKIAGSDDESLFVDA